MATWISVKQAAQLISRPMRTIESWCKRGYVRCKKTPWGYWLVSKKMLLSRSIRPQGRPRKFFDRPEDRQGTRQLKPAGKGSKIYITVEELKAMGYEINDESGASGGPGGPVDTPGDGDKTEGGDADVLLELDLLSAAVRELTSGERLKDLLYARNRTRGDRR